MRKMRFVPVLVLFVVIAGAFSMMPGNMAADGKFSDVPGTQCTPGRQVTLSADSNFDLGTVTAKITQNGVEHVSNFKMDKAHESDSMNSAMKGGGATTTLWAGYRDSDEVAQLRMTVLYDKNIASSEYYDGLQLTFLVTELSGNNVSVLLTGTKGGVETTLSATVQTQAASSSSAAIGKFMQRSSREYYFQEETVPVYALGYNSSADVLIKDAQGNKVAELSAPCAGKLAYVDWKVPKGQTPGNYTISVKPSGGQTDAFGQSGAYSMVVEVQKALPAKINAPSAAPVAMPGWAPFAMVAAVLIVGVPIGVLLIRKKKD
jgi:hypothetical protein